MLDDLAELEVFRTLLEPTGVKGIVVDCPDCDEEHHVEDWALMQANLRQLLDEGQTGRHEPPFDPDPDGARQLGLRQRLRRRGRPRWPSGRSPAAGTPPAASTPARTEARNATRPRCPGNGAPRCGEPGGETRSAQQAAAEAGGHRLARSLAPSLRNSRRAWVLMVSSDR